MANFKQNELIISLKAPKYNIEDTLEIYKQKVQDSANAFAEYQQAELVKVYPVLAKETKQNTICLRKNDINIDDWITNLKKLDNVFDVMKNNIFIVPTNLYPNDPLLLQDAYKWHLEAANVPKVWEEGITGSKDIVVAIMDTGFDRTHPDIIDNAIQDKDGNWGYFCMDDGTEFDDYIQAHGTAMAGIVGAKGNNELGVAGICWNVSLLNIYVFNFQDTTYYLTSFLSGMEYILDQKIKGLNIKVVNMSFMVYFEDDQYNSILDGTSAFYPIFDAFEKHNILIVCAAGNDGAMLPLKIDFGHGMIADLIKTVRTIPAELSNRFSNIITVTSLNRDMKKPQHGNYGYCVDIAAPGDDIRTVFYPNTYKAVSGTSAATAYVSGVAALLFSQYPTETAEQMKQRIIKSSVENLQLVDLLKNNLSSHIDAYYALHYNPEESEIDFTQPTEIITHKNISNTYTHQNSKLYTIGGFYNQIALTQMATYDFETKIWEKKTDCPIPLTDACAIMLSNNKIFVYDGYTAEIPYKNYDIDKIRNKKIFLYDIENDIWETIYEDFTRFSYTISYIPEYECIIIIGGMQLNNEEQHVYLSSAMRYDINTNNWIEITSTLSTPRIMHTATVLSDNTIIIIGGENYVNNTYQYPATISFFDPITNTFNNTPTNIGSIIYHKCIALPNNCVFVSSGMHPTTNAFVDSYIYNKTLNIKRQYNTIKNIIFPNMFFINNDILIVMNGMFLNSNENNKNIYIIKFDFTTISDHTLSAPIVLINRLEYDISIKYIAVTDNHRIFIISNKQYNEYPKSFTNTTWLLFFDENNQLFYKNEFTGQNITVQEYEQLKKDNNYLELNETYVVELSTEENILDDNEIIFQPPNTISNNVIIELFIDNVESVEIISTDIPVLNVEDTYQIEYVISPISAFDKSVIWSTSDDTIATVDEDGMLTAITSGKVDITITTVDGNITDTCTVEVKTDVTEIHILESIESLSIGETKKLSYEILPLTATNKNAVWSTSDNTIATVDEDGNVVGIALGEVTITITSDDGSFTDTITFDVIDAIVVESIEIISSETTLEIGQTLYLSYEILPINATNKNITLSTSDESIATVIDNTITGVALGEVTITVTTEDGSFTDTITLDVVDAIVVESITLTNNKYEIFSNEDLKLSYEILPINATNKNVIWSTSDNTIATVDEDGDINILQGGYVDITVTTEDGSFTDTCTIIIKNETITLPEWAFPVKNLSEYASVKLSDNRLFICGGYNLKTNEVSKKCFILDFNKHEVVMCKDMMEGRYGHTVSYHENKLYVCGGINDTKIVLNTFVIFDIFINEWFFSDIILPNATTYHNADIIKNNFLVVANGWTNLNSFTFTKKIQIYNFETKVWVSLTSKELKKSQSVVCDNGIYYSTNGGYSYDFMFLNTTNILSSAWSVSYNRLGGYYYNSKICKYDNNSIFVFGISDKKTAIVSYNTSWDINYDYYNDDVLFKTDCKLIYTKKGILIIGGYDTNNNFSKQINIFNFKTQTMKKHSILSYNIYEYDIFCTDDDTVYIFNGFLNNQNIKRLDLILSETDFSYKDKEHIETISTLNTSRILHTTTKLQDGSMLISGGFDIINSSCIMSCELFKNYNIEENNISLNIGRYDHTALLLSTGNVIFIGGLNESLKTVTDVEIYDATTKTCSVVGSINIGRKKCSITLLPDDNILIVGGLSDKDKILSDVEIYNTTTNQSTTITPTIQPRYNHKAIYMTNENEVWIIGGRNKRDLKSVEIFDVLTQSWINGKNLNYEKPNPFVYILDDVLFVGNLYESIEEKQKQKYVIEKYDVSKNDWVMDFSFSEYAMSYTYDYNDKKMLLLQLTDAQNNNINNVFRHDSKKIFASSSLKQNHIRNYCDMKFINDTEAIITGGIYINKTTQNIEEKQDVDIVITDFNPPIIHSTDYTIDFIGDMDETLILRYDISNLKDSFIILDNISKRVIENANLVNIEIMDNKLELQINNFTDDVIVNLYPCVLYNIGHGGNQQTIQTNIELPKPIIQNSIIHQTIDNSVDTTIVDYAVDNSDHIQSIDTTKINVSGATLGNVEVTNNVLHIELLDLWYGDISINILENAVVNQFGGNRNEIHTIFSTILPQNIPVILNSTLHEQTNIDINNEIVSYAIDTGEETTQLSIDTSKIILSNVTLKNAYIENKTLKLVLNSIFINQILTATITLQAGVISSYGVLSTNEITTTIELPFYETQHFGERGIFGGGYTGSSNSVMDYITISNNSDAILFGNLTVIRRRLSSGSTSSRGVFIGGSYSTMEYITFASISNGTSFGNIVRFDKRDSCSDATRNIIAGGTNISIIDYITMQTLSESNIFGNMIVDGETLTACSDNSRGIFAGGMKYTTYATLSRIEYITISTLGNSQVFGNLTVARRMLGSCDNATYGVMIGGTPNSTVIDYITIATLGNAQTFGSTVTNIGYSLAGTSNGSKGVFSSGNNDTGKLFYITINTKSDASSFGNLFVNRYDLTACSGN